MPENPQKSNYPKTYLGTYFLGRNDLGFVKSPDFKDQTIEIQNHNRLTAMHRDSVEFTLISNKKDQLVGKIISIKKRTKHGFTGIITQKDNSFILSPAHSKDDLIITIENGDHEMLGLKGYAEITDWSDFESKNIAKGVIKEILGVPGDNDTEMKALAIERGFTSFFPPACLEEADQFVTSFETDIQNELKIRPDLRHLNIFTIDPEDAKDFDDALSIEWLEDGKYRLGVHIADVSFYVREHSDLDDEAKQRATSVYLVDRTIPMLPEQLSNNLCSLKPNVDRLAMSAIFTYDQNDNLLDLWFGKTVIHSKKRFTYEEAFSVLVNKAGTLYEELDFINQKTKKWREQRFANGALNLESEEVKFILDENNKPIDVKVKIRNEAHFLIEECMLLANKEVATFMAKQKKTFIYRIHDKPLEEKTLELALYFKKIGYPVKIKNGVIPSNEIKRLLDSAKSDEEKSAIQTAVIRSQAKAIYSIENIGHFGLGFLYYTHFTSPIRRYPDLIVHRLLANIADQKTSKKDYEDMARHSSDREKDAQEAEWGSIKYKQIEYLAQNPGPHFGVITGVTKTGLYVMEHKTRADGFVFVRNLNDDYYHYDEKKNILIGNKHRKTFAIGDHVTIKVVKTDLEQLTIDYAIITS